MSDGTFAHWPLEIARLALALITYLLLGRLALELAGIGRERLLVRAVCRLTNPIVGAIAAITPRVVPAALLTPCTLVWVLAARVALVQLGALLALRRLLG